MSEQCNSVLINFDSPANGKQCIFVYGHGGEHFYPEDSLDHSDEIRKRVLKDRITQLEQQHEADTQALREALELLVRILRRVALKSPYYEQARQVEAALTKRLEGRG